MPLMTVLLKLIYSVKYCTLQFILSNKRQNECWKSLKSDLKSKIKLEIKVISRAWKSQKSGLNSEISWLVSKSRTRFQQVSDPSDSAGETGLGGQEG